MSAATPGPWRQGSKVPQNVYAANGAPIAQFHDASVAALVVEAVNRFDALADALAKALDEDGNRCDEPVDCGCWQSMAHHALRLAGRL